MTRSPVKQSKSVRRDGITDELIRQVCGRLADDRQVRRTLPDGGRLHIDRRLPFLCVYRRPAARDDAGTEKTITGEASYLLASGDAKHQSKQRALIEGIVGTLSPAFGAMLLLEVWAGDEHPESSDPANPNVDPVFRVFASESVHMDWTLDALIRGLRDIKVMKRSVRVDVKRNGRTRPPDLKPLISRKVATECRVEALGIELPTVYRSLSREQDFPLLLRTFRRRLAIALRKTFFAFVHSRTTHRPPHFHELGRRAVVKAVWQVDKQLADVGNRFDYLLSVTPINTSAAWHEFRRLKFRKPPEFHYTPLPFDPIVLKRQLFSVPLERIEDAALYNLFLQKQEELDRKINMLRDRNTPRFQFGSLAQFGGVSKSLLAIAQEILEQLPPGKRRRSGSPAVTAGEFAQRAEEEIKRYRRIDPSFSPTVRLTDTISGIMVSRGELLVAPDCTFPDARVNPLLQHEVGTHLVTWHNGRSQPFQQLKFGLAGYEELQEGLAVLAEYLVNGLTRLRLRQLAGRIMAVHSMLDGVSFVDTFRLLTRTYDFQQHTAYTITMRVFRGGGFTKDAVYLRGLQAVIDYVRKGGDLELLFVGKIAAGHIPIIRELRYRQVLKSPPLVPRYVTGRDVTDRLQRLRDRDMRLSELVSDASD